MNASPLSNRPTVRKNAVIGDVQLFADNAYQGSNFHKGVGKILTQLDIEIVKRSDQAKGYVVLPKRWNVPRTIAWLNRCRRLDIERSVANYGKALIFFVAIKTSAEQNENIVHNWFSILRLMSVLVLLVIVPFMAYAEQLPVLGTDAESISQYDATVEDAGRPLHWNLNFMAYNKPLNTTLLNNLAARDVTHVVVTLELQDKLADIANGTLDADLKAASDQMSLWHQAHPNIQMIVRPFHEMNGSWYPWGFEGGHNGNSVSQFVPAWKHVRRVMRSEFPQLAFMWCPSILFYSDDDYSLYYPGNDHVEYLGLDGYNYPFAGDMDDHTKCIPQILDRDQIQSWN